MADTLARCGFGVEQRLQRVARLRLTHQRFSN